MSTFTAEQLNDLRRRVLAGEVIDRETLQQARQAIRSMSTAASMGAKKKDEAEALGAAVASDALDF